MNATRTDAATSTDDIIKGRPLCLFYFAHPFGVLSCEPPMVLAPAPAAEPAPAPPPSMARRSPTWPAAACARRLPPHIRTLPPLKLPSPKDFSSRDSSSGDVWSRSSLVPADKKSLPPIELPGPRGGTASEGRLQPAQRTRRPGPVGVRKGGGPRSRGAALARLLRRAVATGESGVQRSGGGCGRGRLAWLGALTPPRTSVILSASTAGAGGGDGGGGSSAGGSMGPRARPHPLLHRRYSVPETVMRRYRLACEQSETEECTWGRARERGAAASASREMALLRRAGGAGGGAGPSPCCCDVHSLDGSRSDVCPPPARLPRSPLFTLAPPSTEDTMPVAATPPTADLLEVVVSETTPAARVRTPRPPDSRSSARNVNIDEYVSNILVDSLNSLTDRLESMTVSIGGGDGRISVIEKEIKVKLQNKGVNTVVHLSPTSNNQIIFGSKELCERDASNVPPPPVERLFCDELVASAESWCAPPRAVSPCASLVDSLDDPMSPRSAPPPPPPPPASLQPAPTRPAPPPPSPPLECDTSLTTPMSSMYTDVDHSPQRERCESFFIRMNEDNCACEKENIVVADHMPEKIKQRLYRRHRRREMRAQGARRGGTRRCAQRDVQRHCAALLDALVDDAVARVARDEHRHARIARPTPNLHSRARQCNRRNDDSKVVTESQPREEAKPAPRVPTTSPQAAERIPPRRLYHKSEIHDGGKCIEILEIVEYTNTSRSSSETNSDEGFTTRGRKSRIPVPINSDKGEASRMRRASVAFSTLPITAVTGPSAMPRRASVPAIDHCAPGLLRFERVFDVIPEERSSISVDSASEDSRVPQAVVPARRSAATSPLAPPEKISSRDERARDRRSIGTQWTRASPVRTSRIPSDHITEEEIGLPEGEMRSSSECEYESTNGARGPKPLSTVSQQRIQGGLRVRRRAVRRAPPPPRPATRPRIDSATPTQKNSATQSSKVDSVPDGWSLTLAGSCRAALPSRLDLRLRFPPPSPPAPPRPARSPPSSRSRSDATTDRCSDVGSQHQDRRLAICRHSTSIQCAHKTPAIRCKAGGAGVPVRGRRRCRHSPECARDAALPALHAPPPAPPPRLTHAQRRGACCRGCGPPPPPPPPPLPSPPSPTPTSSRSHLHKTHHRKLPSTRGACAKIKAEPCGGASGATGALAVLGCAIVPERRAPPPTASERDVHRARLRHHHPASTAALGAAIRCLCYT